MDTHFMQLALDEAARASEYYTRRAPEIVTGVLEAESRALLAEYVKRTGIRAHLAT